MLSAGIEAATNFDMQILYRFIQSVAFLSQPLAQLSSQPAGCRNSKLAGVCPRAGRNIDNRPRARLAESDRFERGIHFWQVHFTDPAQDDVLFHGRANGPVSEATSDISNRAQLVGGDIT